MLFMNMWKGNEKRKKKTPHTYHSKKRSFLWCGREVKRLNSNVGLILRLCNTKSVWHMDAPQINTSYILL